MATGESLTANVQLIGFIRDRYHARGVSFDLSRMFDPALRPLSHRCLGLNRFKDSVTPET
jgi:hypothetical protein